MKNYKIALPCLRGVVGNWVYYSSLMNAEQISNTVSTVKEIREATTLDEVLQRKLKERKRDIARYILKTESRFFNSIILGVFDGVPDWIEFDLLEQFKSELRDSDISNSENSMGIMVFEGDEKIFAIDGQHRVEGIKIAFEKEKEKIKDDQYSVIFIAHIDDEEGRIRTRRLFSDINTNAKQVSKGDRIIIDEDDINAIVARKLYKDYVFFNSGREISVSEQSNLDKEDTTYFTNLIALHSVNKHLFKIFKKEGGTGSNDIENVASFYAIVEAFYNFVIYNIDEYSSYFIEKTLGLNIARHNNSHYFFRPVGLIFLARIYVYYYLNNLALEELKKLNRLSFIFPGSHLEKIVWNNGKMDVRMKNQTLAVDLTLFILKKFPQDKEDELLKRYREITKQDHLELPDKLD